MSSTKPSRCAITRAPRPLFAKVLYDQVIDNFEFGFTREGHDRLEQAAVARNYQQVPVVSRVLELEAEQIKFERLVPKQAPDHNWRDR